MLDKLSKESFAPYLGETFQLDLGASGSVDVHLVEVRALKPYGSPPAAAAAAPTPREPFAIVFQGPPQPPLGQGMYRVEHEKVGTIEHLFLVPVGADQQGRYYEAVFN